MGKGLKRRELPTRVGEKDTENALYICMILSNSKSHTELYKFLKCFTSFQPQYCKDRKGPCIGFSLLKRLLILIEYDILYKLYYTAKFHIHLSSLDSINFKFYKVLLSNEKLKELN